MNSLSSNALPYQPLNGHWDEAVSPSGFPRRHWRTLAVEVGRMGFEQLSRRWVAGQQLIQAEGITYNVGGLPSQSEYSWPMDPIPLVISEQEWSWIERALIQRATLLNAIVADVYGPQRLLYERRLPAALVFDNPQFLRPCVGITPPSGIHLHTYAADLARSPDGRWWVIADRTQAPSGMGYTLQNRLVSARAFPGIFDKVPVRQLARFFDAKRDTLIEMAAAQRPQPTIVLLTPGPHSETHFEHSFLAGRWGFSLVEGADLTVLDQRVYLKTLGGLKQVDLILRRMDDSFCDPLELRSDSLLGVPGLVGAVRSGNVIVDNTLGSGVIETAAHMAFLPGLCRHLLGEDLLLPSVATWWCGQEEPRRYVLDHLDELVIKPAFPQFGKKAEFPEFMNDALRSDLIRRIESRPGEFVAQERMALSTVPVRSDEGFLPRQVVLRGYAAWTSGAAAGSSGASYSVMPGGLSRVSSKDDSPIVSMHQGGGSKDTWVLGNTDEPIASARHFSAPMDASIRKGDLPSRVADNLFWLGRYTERVEARARFVRALLPALSGEEDFGRTVSLEASISLLAAMQYLPPETAKASLGEQRWFVQRILTEMIFDSSHMSKLRWSLKEMRRVSWHLKERLSLDTWRVIQQLETEFSAFVPGGADQRYLAGMELLDRVIVTLSAFSGLLMENTTRGFGWRFLEIGRRMERALQLSELLRSGMAAASSDIEPHLQILLQIADSSITYRSQYSMALQTDLVLQLLLADESNPRSVGFQLATLVHQIRRLQENEGTSSDGIESMASKILLEVRYSDMENLAKQNAENEFAALEELLGNVRSTLYELSEALTARYLTHLTASRLTASL